VLLKYLYTRSRYVPGGISYADRVQKQVQIAKRNSAWRREYMNWEMTLSIERDKGETLKTIRQIIKKAALGQSEEKISEDLLEDVSYVHDICSIIASFGNKTIDPDEVFIKYLDQQRGKCH